MAKIVQSETVTVLKKPVDVFQDIQMEKLKIGINLAIGLVLSILVVKAVQQHGLFLPANDSSWDKVPDVLHFLQNKNTLIFLASHDLYTERIANFVMEIPVFVAIAIEVLNYKLIKKSYARIEELEKSYDEENRFYKSKRV